jgi:phosphate starvation-inducible protein PhoH and related proteins
MVESPFAAAAPVPPERPPTSAENDIPLPGMTQLTLAEEGLETIFGTQDENLRRIERDFGVTVNARGAEVSVQGDPEKVAPAVHLLRELSALAASGYRFRPSDVQTAIRVIRDEPEGSLAEFFNPEGPLEAARRLVTPRTHKQLLYMKAIAGHDLVVSVGPAGTGKTYLAVAMAASDLLEKKVKRIVLARPAVEAGEKLGFLPGDLAEKVNPYLRPLYDALYDVIGFEKVGKLLERQVIEVAPLAFMRGRTLNDSFIILDEAQNTTPEQMKMFLTRIGYNSKAVINGDVTQVDLPQGRASGLVEAQEVLAGIVGISFFRFSKADVVRHPLVQKIVDAYETFEERRVNRPAEAAAAALSAR